MKHRARRKFSFIYWGFLIVMAAFLCYRQGREKLDQCDFAKGEVINQVWLKRGHGRYSAYGYRPQITFPVKDTAYIFTDMNTSFENGETVTVVYPRNNPRDARVYTFRMWIDLGIIVPIGLIGGFIYSVVVISFTKYGKSQSF